jgi:predicted secreted acid phosphatase
MTRVLGLLTVLVLALGPGAAHVDASSPKRDVPTRDQWLADVKAVMSGSHGVVRARVASKAPGEELAVNFDIDNTVIATYYDGGGAIPKMLKFARFLERQRVAVLFNTGRLGEQRKRTVRQLERNGFPVDGLCLRGQGKTLAYGKQRCRDKFIERGYTLIANVGNNDTDFEGHGYERAYVLPNYDGALG